MGKKLYKNIPYIVLIVIGLTMISLEIFPVCDQSDLFAGMCFLGKILVEIILAIFLANYGLMLWLTRKQQNPLLRLLVCLSASVLATIIEIVIFFVFSKI